MRTNFNAILSVSYNRRLNGISDTISLINNQSEPHTMQCSFHRFFFYFHLIVMTAVRTHTSAVAVFLALALAFFLCVNFDELKVIRTSLVCGACSRDECVQYATRQMCKTAKGERKKKRNHYEFIRCYF